MSDCSRYSTHVLLRGSHALQSAAFDGQCIGTWRGSRQRVGMGKDPIVCTWDCGHASAQSHLEDLHVECRIRLQPCPYVTRKMDRGRIGSTPALLHYAA